MKQPPPGVFNRKTEMTLSLTTKSYFGTPVSEICPNNCPQTEHDARGKLRASRNKGAGWDQSSSIRFKGGLPKLTATKLAQEGSE